MTNRIELNWDVPYAVDEQRYYCSETPIDIENLPVPKAIIAGDARTYTDIAIEVGKTYYVAVGSVRGGVEKVSQELRVFAVGDEFIDNVVSLLNFESDLTDFKGSIWTQTSPQVVNNGVIVNSGDTAIKTSAVLLSGTDKFTIEADITFITFPSNGGFWQRSVIYGKTLNQAMGEYAVFFESDGKVVLDLRGVGASYYTSTNAKTIVSGQRVHIAHTYDGAIHKVYIDGVEFIEAAYTTGFNANANAQPLQLGYMYVPSYESYASWINGKFNAFRITKGVVRYTDTFDPPDVPFPSN